MLFNCSIHFVDADLRKCTRSVEIEDDNIADCITTLNLLISALADISDARIVAATVSHRYDVIDAEASTTSNVDAGMSCRFELDTEPARFASFNVPSPELSIRDGKGGLDMDNPDVVTFASVMTGNAIRLAHAQSVQLILGTLDR